MESSPLGVSSRDGNETGLNGDSLRPAPIRSMFGSGLIGFGTGAGV